MTTDRTLEGWVKKSHRLRGISQNHLLPYNFQSLGKLDCILNDEWKAMKHRLTEQENIIKFDHHSFQSSLWVMAAYELMRILKTIDARPESKEVYKLFRRVRIPLVKFEAAEGHSHDFGIAYGAIGQETEDLGWAIGPKMFVTRNELADALYNLYGA